MDCETRILLEKIRVIATRTDGWQSDRSWKAEYRKKIDWIKELVDKHLKETKPD